MLARGIGILLCCLGGATLPAGAALAGAADARPARPGTGAQPGACLAAIARAERDFGIPHGLLHAIALVESGRRNGATGAIEPWPWSFNHRGTPHVFRTRGEAVAAVEALHARGERSVDVGCMQVNLHFHGDAFGSVEQAFDPVANVRYAAGFLVALRRRTGGWVAAAAHYHSGTPRRQDAYLGRLLAAWEAAGPPGPGPSAAPRRQELAEAPR